MISSKATHTTVTALILDLTQAVNKGDTGCFTVDEIQPVLRKMISLASQGPHEVTYNAKARLYVWGLLVLKLDSHEGAEVLKLNKCPIMWLLQYAHEDLLARMERLKS